MGPLLLGVLLWMASRCSPMSIRDKISGQTRLEPGESRSAHDSEDDESDSYEDDYVDQYFEYDDADDTDRKQEVYNSNKKLEYGDGSINNDRHANSHLRSAYSDENYRGAPIGVDNDDDDNGENDYDYIR